MPDIYVNSVAHIFNFIVKFTVTEVRHSYQCSTLFPCYYNSKRMYIYAKRICPWQRENSAFLRNRQLISFPIWKSLNSRFQTHFTCHSHNPRIQRQATRARIMRIINIVFARNVWTHPFVGRDNQQHEPHPVPIGVYARCLCYLVYAQKEIRVSRIRLSRKAHERSNEPEFSFFILTLWPF